MQIGHTVTLKEMLTDKQKVCTVHCSYFHHVLHVFHSSAVILHSIVGSVHSRLFHVLRLLISPVQNQLPA